MGEPLAQVLQLEAVSAGFSWQVPAGWKQGRGLFGGLVVAAMVRALERNAGEGRVLRSLTAELPAPTREGVEARLTVEVLREGSGVSTLAVKMRQGDEVTAHAVGVLGRARVSDVDAVVTPPPPPSEWQTVEPLPIEPPIGPEFATHWEFRNTGPLPFARGVERHAEGWIRPKPASGLFAGQADAAYLAACIDGWWPAVAVGFTSPRPVGTIAFTLQITDGLSSITDAPLRFASRVLVTHEGYSVEQRELWSETGRLLALNQQTIAIIA